MISAPMAPHSSKRHCSATHDPQRHSGDHRAGLTHPGMSYTFYPDRTEMLMASYAMWYSPFAESGGSRKLTLSWARQSTGQLRRGGQVEGNDQKTCDAAVAIQIEP